MDPIERRTIHQAPESTDDAERGWSRLMTFPIMLAAIVGLLWRSWRERRGGGRALVPDVPHPRVFKDVHLI